MESMPLAGQPDSNPIKRFSGHRPAPLRRERTLPSPGMESHSPLGDQVYSQSPDRAPGQGEPLQQASRLHVHDGRGQGPSCGKPDSGHSISLWSAGHQPQEGCLHQAFVLDLKTFFSLRTSEQGLHRIARRPLESDRINMTCPPAGSQQDARHRPQSRDSLPRTACQGWSWVSLGGGFAIESEMRSGGGWCGGGAVLFLPSFHL